MVSPRHELKRALARTTPRTPAEGVTVLIYHRIGGPGRDEMDMHPEDFSDQMRLLASQQVVSLDEALAGLRRGETASRVVLTFDDGFADVYTHAWPILRGLGLPFTVYLATAHVGGEMRWEGSTAKAPGAPALTWRQLEEMVASGLCTVGNHTHSHARPEALSEEELDRCNQEVEEHLGVVSKHFAYPWGQPVPSMDSALGARFDSAATGRLGRNVPGTDPLRLMRVPVRRTDPVEFFRAKLAGNLRPERLYAGIVETAKRVGAHA